MHASIGINNAEGASNKIRLVENYHHLRCLNDLQRTGGHPRNSHRLAITHRIFRRGRSILATAFQGSALLPGTLLCAWAAIHPALNISSEIFAATDTSKRSFIWASVTGLTTTSFGTKSRHQFSSWATRKTISCPSEYLIVFPNPRCFVPSLAAHAVTVTTSPTFQSLLLS